MAGIIANQQVRSNEASMAFFSSSENFSDDLEHGLIQNETVIDPEPIAVI